MIEIKNLSKSFNKPVLDDLNITVENGSIFGLIGVNGAGKTTFLNIISGITKADSGQVLYDEVDVFDNSGVKRDIFYLPDEPYYSRTTTPKNLVDVYKAFYDVSLEDYFGYLDRFKLPKEKTMYNFSKGMRRQVFVALALAIKPKYLFLDEVFDGLDPLARLNLKKELLRVQDETNMTVIISSHSLRELEDICDSYGIIDSNKIRYQEMDDFSNKYHKYTMAFNGYLYEKDFDINFVSFAREKRIINCITTLDYDQMEERIRKLEPIVLEELPLGFEDSFLIEIKGKGYLE